MSITRSEIKSLYQRFLSLCDAYNENQDILTALTLGEVASQLKSAATDQLDDPVMHDLLHQMPRAIAKGDMAAFHQLLDATRTAADKHDLA